MKTGITSKNTYFWIMVCFCTLFNATAGFAADTTLTWQPPTENADGSPLDDLDGYILYYGTTTQTYTQSIDVGNVTTYQVSGLSYGTAYYFALTAYDTSGNESVYSTELVKTLQAPDTTAPVISNIQAGSITYSSAEISWTTDEASDTQVEYGTTTSYGSTTTLSASMVTGHSASLGSLTGSTLYHYRVLSSDAAGNPAVSGDNTFTTSDPPDTTAPVISNIQAGSITNSSAEISWTTDEASDTQVEYGTTTSYGSTTTLSASMVTGHSASLGSLSASTLYHYRVRSADAADNQAVSGDNTFTTSEAPHNYYCDSDSDSYFNATSDGTCAGEGCEPSGCQAQQGNDCNDGNAGIHPGAKDIANDGIDQDCSGSDYVDTVAPKAPTTLTAL